MTPGSYEQEVARREALGKQIKDCDRELEKLQAQRPAAALASENGDGKALTKLDEELSRVRERRQTLADAVEEARRFVRWAAQRELIPFVEVRLDAARRFEKAQADFLAAFFELQRAGADADATAQRVGENQGGFMFLPEQALALIAKAFGIVVRDPWLHTEPRAVSEHDARLRARLEELRKEPQLKKPARRDDAKGYIAAMQSLGKRLLHGRAK